MSRVLILRACDKDGKSYGDFQWPLEVGAIVKAPNAARVPICGYGLHGLLNGGGDYFALRLNYDSKLIVFSAEEGDVVPLDGKVKVVGPCRVEWVGNLFEFEEAFRLLNIEPGEIEEGETIYRQGEREKIIDDNVFAFYQLYNSTILNHHHGTAVSKGNYNIHLHLGRLFANGRNICNVTSNGLIYSACKRSVSVAIRTFASLYGNGVAVALDNSSYVEGTVCISFGNFCTLHGDYLISFGQHCTFIPRDSFVVAIHNRTVATDLKPGIHYTIQNGRFIYE